MNALFRKTVAFVVYVSFVSVHVLGCGVQSAPVQVRYRGDSLPSFVLPTPLPPPVAPAFEVLPPESELEDFSPNFTVTSSGAATWTHPLQLLPGRNGMSPSLSITYSSSGAAGALGRGFSLDGPESIARCWPVRAQGSGAVAASLSPGVSSVFCLNGTRLMPRPNESADRLSPERDPSTLVVVAGGMANPTSFTVYRANGLITGFGARPFSSARREGRLRTLDGARLQGNPSMSFATDDLAEVRSSSQTTVEWKQDITRDRYGNEVRYDYDARTNASGDVVELLLREVSWTANTQQSLGAKRRARLTYGQDRPDARSGFRMGLPTESTKLLTSVEVFGPSGLTSDSTHNEVLHWRYEFTYRQVKEGTRQEGVLDTMRRCFPSGNCTVPVRFEWQGFEESKLVFALQSPQDNTVDFDHAWAAYNGVVGAYDLVVADLDNDGFDDALYRVPHMSVTNLGNWMPERDLISGAVLTDWRLRRGGRAGLSGVEEPLGLPTIYGGSSKFSPRAADLDGDGKSELLLYFEEVFSGTVAAGYASYSLNGKHFLELNRESTNPYFVTIGEVRRAAPMTLGDFDGDGSLDMVRDLPPAGSAAVGTVSGELLSMRDVNQRGTTTCQVHSGVFGKPNVLLRYDPLGGSRSLDVFDFGERLALDADGDGQTDLVQDIDRQECIPERTSTRPGDPIPSLTHWTLSTVSRLSGTAFGIAETAIPAGPLEKSPLAGRVFGACVPNPIPNPAPPNSPSQCAPTYDHDSRTAMARLVGDFNGDGLRDVLSFPSRYTGGCGCVNGNCSTIDYSTQVFLNVNRGNTFAPVEVLSNPWTAGGTTSALPSSIRSDKQQYAAGRPIDNGLRVVDLDGDGADDIVQVASQGHAGEPMKLFRLQNGGFTTTELNLPFAHQGLWLGNEGSMNPISTEGYGPRMTQFGDVNGDGQLDLVTMTDMVTAYLQEPRSPLLLTGISSSVTDGQTIAYNWGRGEPTSRLNDPRPGAPRSTADHVALYNRSVTCASPQRCVTNIGWVVSTQTLASGAVISHSYADARIDTNGRGFLGVAEHRMLIGNVEVFDLFDHVSLIGSPGAADGYVYRQPNIPRWHVVRGATQREVEFTTNPLHSVTISSEFAKGGTWPLLRSTREVIERDSHHQATRTLTTTSDVLLPGHADNQAANATLVGNWEQTEVRRSGPGANCETPSACGGGEGWLLGRYPALKRTYRRNNGTEESIVWQLAYEPLTVDVRSSTKNRDGFGSQNSGYLREMVLTRDALGNVTQTEEIGSGAGSNNSPSTRTTTVGFATNDVERVFSNTHTNALGMPEFEHRLAATGLPIALDDIAARRVGMAYDEAGRVVRTTPAVGPETAFSYISDATGVTRRVVRAGVAVSTKFNRAGQLVRRLEEGRSFTLFQYDLLGRLEKASLPLAWSANDNAALFVIYERDDDGRITATSRPGESGSAARPRRAVIYDGNVVTRVSESGAREETRLDALGRPSVTTAFATNGEDAITRYQYGRWGKLEEITHPWSIGAGPTAPAKTIITYDAYGRQLTLNDPDTGLTRSEYTAFDELYSSTDGNGATTTYSWDALGRLVLEETPLGTYKALDPNSPFSRRNLFEYDSAPNGLGQLARATSMASPTSGSHFVGEVTTTWQYDSFGRTIATQWNEAGSQRTFEYGYDPTTAELSTLKYPRFEAGSAAVAVWAEFIRAPDGSVMGVDSLVGGQRQTVWRATQLDPVGQIVEEVFGSAIKGSRRYDATYALRFQEVRPESGSASFQRLSYVWGSDGLLSRRTDLDLWSEEQFEHDAFQRLTKWTVKQNCIANEWRYSYDPSGNLLTRALHPNGGAATHPTTFTYDAATPHRAMNSRIEGTDFALKYHPGGQVREALGNQYEWTPFDLPVSMTAMSSGTTSQLTYDAFGARTSSLTPNVALTITLAGLYELRSTLTRQEATYNFPGRDGVVAQVQLSQDFSTSTVENTTRYLHLDHLGNPDAVSTVSNGTPRLLERGKYEPFGERRSPWALATPHSQTPTQTAYGFTGHSIDVAQGITNMRGRLYDQRLARFLSPDPIAHPVGQALNRYSYVRNSPAILTDPSGFDPPAQPTNVDLEGATIVGECQGECPRRVVTSTNTTQWEGGDVGRSSDEFRTVEVFGVPIQYRPFESELRAWGDYAMLRDRRIMSADDMSKDAKPFDFSLINLIKPDERFMWDMAKSAKGNVEAGLAAGATGKGAWHFGLALGAVLLIGATFAPGEGTGTQAVAKSGLAARVRALRSFGLDKAARRVFLSGETAGFLRADGVLAFARMEGSRLVAGIFSVNAPGKGLRIFSKFRGDAKALGQSLGATELELAGAEFLNLDLGALLVRQGFVAGTMAAPEALGGGTMNILSKVFGL